MQACFILHGWWRTS
ncbi:MULTISPECIES: trp operon leader peptide [Citrobacter]|uniref:trp operon leader peptide n=1 Tax=Citrobacter sedlakii TaxID=67826 RepID=A0ABS0ZM66_9ENTR|nr:trp operon leader peptide [Citrobacter sedlakii]QMK48264.1 trp operon leader peptide [Citrobacter sp. RHB21-C05]QMK66707.1 trp operon leader peptide [Citrobacter sp. RHB21-C01]EHG7611762.1 trp operon leader peptide [Citrobacter sedlakii]EIQ7156441.1 trp operon leader peptide [Citrobacter sedlakii]